MAVRVAEAELENPRHVEAILMVLDSYASDPIGGGRPLTAEVRERLVPGLRRHPMSLVLLAFDGDERCAFAG